MSRVCPWCQEPIPFRDRKAETCPHCSRSLARGEDELRPIDLRYDEVEAAQREAYRQLLTYGGGAAVLIFLVLPLLHGTLTPALAVPLVMVAHMITVRIMLVRKARRLLGTTRRIFVRWITRLAFLWIGSIGYGLTALPLLGAVFGVGTFVGLTALVHHYTAWSLAREHKRLPLALWEKLTLISLALLTIGALVAAVAIAALVGWSLAWLIEKLSAA